MRFAYIAILSFVLQNAAFAGGPITEIMKFFGKAVGKDAIGEAAENGAKKAVREAVQSSASKSSQLGRSGGLTGLADEAVDAGKSTGKSQATKTKKVLETGERATEIGVTAADGDNLKSITETVKNNKALIIGGAAVTSVAAAPEATLGTVGSAAVAVGENVVKPVVGNAISKVAVPIVTTFPLFTLLLVVVSVAFAGYLRRSWLLRKSLWILVKLGFRRVLKS